MSDETLRVGGRAVTVTHADKVLVADGDITKSDLAAYYSAVGPVMVPHLRGRPLSVQRFPDGIDGGGFMQKHMPPSIPRWVHHAEVSKVDGGTVDMYVCDNAATLVYLANQAGLTLHPWMSTVRSVHTPDRTDRDTDGARARRGARCTAPGVGALASLVRRRGEISQASRAGERRTANRGSGPPRTRGAPCVGQMPVPPPRRPGDPIPNRLVTKPLAQWL